MNHFLQKEPQWIFFWTGRFTWNLCTRGLSPTSGQEHETPYWFCTNKLIRYDTAEECNYCNYINSWLCTNKWIKYDTAEECNRCNYINRNYIMPKNRRSHFLNWAKNTLGHWKNNIQDNKFHVHNAYINLKPSLAYLRAGRSVLSPQIWNYIKQS